MWADAEDQVLPTLESMIVQGKIVGYHQLLKYIEDHPYHYPMRVRHTMDSIQVGDRFVDADHPEQGVNVIVLSPPGSNQIQTIDAAFKRWRYRMNHNLFTWVNLYVARYFTVHVDAKMRGVLLWDG